MVVLLILLLEKLIKKTSPTTTTMETSQKSTQTNSQTLTYLSEDFLAKLFQSLENEKDLKIPEGQCSLKLREYCEQNNLDYSSLKMLKDCLVMTTETLSEPSSPRLMNWGMTSNGKCLTAKITEYPRIGNECSLSDILEEQVDQKYFLSEKMINGLMTGSPQFQGRFGVSEKTGISPTLTSRYYKMGKTDPYISED